MSDAPAKALSFTALHVPGAPLVLFNIWDAGSAKIVAAAGAAAIATGSWSVATAHGHDDGEATPIQLVLDNAGRIVRSVELPVTLDFEMGYGATPADVSTSIGRALHTGVVGFNIEDGLIGQNALRPVGEQCARLQAARKTCDARGVAAYINARTDIFLINSGHNMDMVKQAVERAHAYKNVGASGFFAPGLADLELVESLCAASPLPVNIMASSQGPSRAALAGAGVARISHGPHPYRLMAATLAEATQKAMA